MDARAEFQKIQADRTYFTENYLRIKTKGIHGRPKLIPFKYKFAQKVLNGIVEKQEQAGKPVRVIILKARQEGISTYVEGYIFANTILNKLTKSIVVAHDTPSAIHLFSMSQLFYECLPPQFRPMKRYSNRRELLFENPDDKARPSNPGLRSHMQVGTANNLDLGRSATIQNAHCSEFASWSDPDTTFLSLMQSVPDAAGSAVFIESTAKGVGNAFHQMWVEAQSGQNDFEPVFIPWYWDPDYTMVGPNLGRLDKYEVWLRDACSCSDGQIRWRRWAIKNKCRGSLNKFRQEYPATDLEAFLASGSPVFDQNRLGAMYQSAPDCKFEGELNKKGKIYVMTKSPIGHLHLWKEPEAEKSYIIGADVAEGIKDGDFSAAQVLCREDFEQVAEWHGHIAPDVYGELLADLSGFYSNALLAIETNGPGVATIASARKLYTNLYCQVTQDQLTRKQSKRIGWNTSVRTRPLIVDGISQSLEHLTINSKALIQELMWFIYERIEADGRLKRLHPIAQKGHHDDRVFALGIALQAHIQYPLRNKVAELKKVEKNIVLSFESEHPAASMEERILRKQRELEDPVLQRELRNLRVQEAYGDDWGLDDF